jgi:hypothetical protein
VESLGFVLTAPRREASIGLYTCSLPIFDPANPPPPTDLDVDYYWNGHFLTVNPYSQCSQFNIEASLVGYVAVAPGTPISVSVLPDGPLAPARPLFRYYSLSPTNVIDLAVSASTDVPSDLSSTEYSLDPSTEFIVYDTRVPDSVPFIRCFDAVHAINYETTGAKCAKRRDQIVEHLGFILNSPRREANIALYECNLPPFDPNNPPPPDSDIVYYWNGHFVTVDPATDCDGFNIPASIIGYIGVPIPAPMVSVPSLPLQ